MKPGFPAALRGADRTDKRFDSSRIVVVPAYSFRERACEAIERPNQILAIPAKDHVKKTDRVTNTRHSRESGNRFAALPQEKPARYGGRRLRIPAFAGMTKCYQRVIVFCRAESLGAPTVIVRAILTNTRHSRESGNRFAALPQEKPARYGGRRLRIPAFAGMTKCYQRVIVFCRAESLGAPTVIVRAILTNTRHSRESGNRFAALPQEKPGRYCGRPPPDSRFRGNDEVLSASYCLLPRRILGRSDRHSESHPYKHSSFPRKRESLCGASTRKTGPILRTAASGFPLSRE